MEGYGNWELVPLGPAEFLLVGKRDASCRGLSVDNEGLLDKMPDAPMSPRVGDMDGPWRGMGVGTRSLIAPITPKSLCQAGE